VIQEFRGERGSVAVQRIGQDVACVHDKGRNVSKKF
jgi:hypothetical protein